MAVKGGKLPLIICVVLVALTLAIGAAGLAQVVLQIRFATAASTSMEPAVRPGDRLVYRPGDAVRRGDLVLAREGAGDLLFIRRVIGLPGDRVACCTAQGLITVNGRALREAYVYRGDAPSEFRFSVALRAGQVWLMGDQRTIAIDSRLRGPAALPIARRVTLIDRNGHWNVVRTPAAYIAGGLAPADSRTPVPAGAIVVLIAVVALVAEFVAMLVLLIRWRRRDAAQASPALAPVPPA